MVQPNTKQLKPPVQNPTSGPSIASASVFYRISEDARETLSLENSTVLEMWLLLLAQLLDASWLNAVYWVKGTLRVFMALSHGMRSRSGSSWKAAGLGTLILSGLVVGRAGEQAAHGMAHQGTSLGSTNALGPRMRSPVLKTPRLNPVTSHLTFSEQGLDPTGHASPSLTSCFRLSLPHRQP